MMTWRRVVLALIIPLAVEGILLRLIPDGALLIWPVSALAGFLLLTKRVADERRGTIALVYFPLMFLIFVVAAMFVPWFAIRIHGE
jgi:hypothetical protein